MSTVYIVGTCDTKDAELAYLKSVVEGAGQTASIIDVSTREHSFAADVSAETVAACHPAGRAAVLGLSDRGVAVEAMACALEAFIVTLADVGGVIGIGGSGGTALISPALRALPFGVPKFMVSTVASGDVAPYVGPCDICMMYSVVDVAGLSSALKQVLSNAGHAVAGMAAGYQPGSITSDKAAIGATMFGVTTTCVDAVTEALAEEFDCLVFHATGTGGQSMEKLAASGGLRAALDLTTTELCDHLFGGVFPCLPSRLDVFAQTKTPYVGSVGALDMVNFGARATVPSHYDARNLFVHNPQVTLMRTNVEENRQMGAWLAAKLNQMHGPVRFLLPRGGVSAIDVEGMPFHDPEADAALFAALEADFIATENRQLINVDAAINDPQFSAAAVAALRSVLN